MWNKKQKQSLELTSLQVSYDYSNGTIKLVSQDPQVKGKPFKLTVASDTPTYKTLFQLLEDQGLVDLSRVKLTRDLSDAKLLFSRLQDITRIPIGKTFKDKVVELDLTLSPHVLIAGGSGSGKSVIQRSIILRALSQPEVSLRAIDLKRVELSGYAFRKQDRFASTYESAIDVMRELQTEVAVRYQAFEEAEVYSNASLPTPFPFIYLLIDEAAYLLGSSGVDSLEGRREDLWREEFRLVLDELLRKARAAGVHIILGTQRPDDLDRAGELLHHFGHRISMGAAPRESTQVVLHQKPAFGSPLLTNPGRGLMRLYGGEQVLFQANFIPMPPRGYLPQ